MRQLEKGVAACGLLTRQGMRMLQVGGKLLSFLIGLQGFNRGEANSGYVIAYGQVIESMGCAWNALCGGGREQANGEGGDEEWHIEG